MNIKPNNLISNKAREITGGSPTICAYEEFSRIDDDLDRLIDDHEEDYNISRRKAEKPVLKYD